MAVISIVPVPAIEAMLWDDVKAALIRIGEATDNILEQWIIVGKRLRQIREENPGHSTFSTFSVTARRTLEPDGLTLSGQQMSAAQWWADLEQKWRDKLHAEFPRVTTPEALQKICREKYPEVAKTKKKSKFGLTEFEKKPKKEPKLPIPKPAGGADDTSPQPPSLRRQKEIAEEEHRKLVREQLADRQAKQEAKAARDNRPRCKEMPMPVVLFGVQVWPVADADRARLGHYDYDQLFFGIHQFYAWYDLLPMASDHKSRAITLLHRLKFLYLFVERRLETGADQTEMRRFLQVVEMVADLYKANPTGECSLRPIDACIR